ncbi:MAG: endonuclease/exonuclease/phosphatase family protein [bacterium]|nr:endonuclease/exonuclease/phosphatase family protein [bacterium]
MEGKKKLNRRGFLKISLAGVATLTISCHSAKYQTLGRDCPYPGIYGNKIRVMSFNIANARGNTDEFLASKWEETIRDNLDWIVKLIRNYDIDVVCLNEVDFGSIRTYNIDMASYIANALCYNHVIREKIFDIPSELEVGNAIVSRFPLHLNGHRQYGDGLIDRVRHIFKSFVDFDVLLDDSGRKLNIVLTHLDHHCEKVRCKEVNTLIRHLEGKQNPFVLLGDLNSTPGEKCFEILMKTGLVGNPYLGIRTYPADVPKRAIDHILVSPGLSIQNYHTVLMQASDHLPIIGDISFD